MRKITDYFLENPIVVFVLLFTLTLWGLHVEPFKWIGDWLPKNPVHVDAIPDLGENQQIVQVVWEGCSPQDIDNQITYPLTA